MVDELEAKHERIAQFLAEQSLDALVLGRVANFAWATGGRDGFIMIATEHAGGHLIYTPDEKALVADRIEMPRFQNEEGLVPPAWTPIAPYWHVDRPQVVHWNTVAQGKRTGSDSDIPGAQKLTGDIARLRFQLLPQEVERYRALGQAAAQALELVAHEIAPGMTEHAIASTIAGKAISQGIQAALTLVATDERIFRYRHPIPTAKQLDKYAMLVLCARRHGLICSVSRLVHFGEIPAEIQAKSDACAQVDAAFILGSVPGRPARDVFIEALNEYAKAGFADEWRFHHQGGACGYESRDYKASPVSQEVIQLNQAFAWNPSIAGVKSEDTTLVTAEGIEVLSAASADWPMIAVDWQGKTIERPAILQR
ncbi:MAG: M24 family metallopeptidase [Chloroflexota bacterium]|nr:M24 family metallopeptidase [Chloroflexota bacterium]